jgi:cyclopropane-fatty-acyl-phospholipid synthase
MTSTEQATGWLIDPERWPDVATVATVHGSAGRGSPGLGATVRTVAARTLFRSAVARLPVWVWLPGGQLLGAGSASAPVMELRDPDAFFARLGASGLIGFGESYLAGEWDCTDLTGLISVFAAHIEDLVPPPLRLVRRIAGRRQPAADEQTRDGARRNIGRHYDLSNEFFALFLDQTMTYSSALFDSDGELDSGPGFDAGLGFDAGGAQLARAQRAKIDRLLDQAGVGPGSRVLEIGTGWGELAIRAGRRGATVRTITISQQQHELAVRRVAEAGLTGRVSVELRDYRDVHGAFDAICSVEMIEAVGERYWDAYFAVLDRLLAPGGRVALQTITMAHDRMLTTRHTHTWIQKYIFPGGLIPSVTAIENSLSRGTSLRVTRRLDFGEHYARTLQIWRDRFLARRAEVTQLGFDEVFLRMWLFYLCYAEAGFRSGYLDVSQLTLERA